MSSLPRGERPIESLKLLIPSEDYRFVKRGVSKLGNPYKVCWLEPCDDIDRTTIVIPCFDGRVIMIMGQYREEFHSVDAFGMVYPDEASGIRKGRIYVAPPFEWSEPEPEPEGGEAETVQAEGRQAQGGQAEGGEAETVQAEGRQAEEVCDAHNRNREWGRGPTEREVKLATMIEEGMDFKNVANQCPELCQRCRKGRATRFCDDCSKRQGEDKQSQGYMCHECEWVVHDSIHNIDHRQTTVYCDEGVWALHLPE